MSEEDKNKNTFWDSFINLFKSISLKVKLIIGTVIGAFGVISIFLLRKKINSRQILELELKKLREEIEIEKAQEEINKNNEKLDSLELRAEQIKKEIKELEKFEPRSEVSNEELDDFFDKRGF